MSKLKRNMIELVTNPDDIVGGAEPEFKKYWTPMFLNMSVTLEAIDLMSDLENLEDKGSKGLIESFDLLMNFVADKAYGGQFTTEDLKKGLHAPDAMLTLQEQVMFVAQGQQTDETKKFLAKKN